MKKQSVGKDKQKMAGKNRWPLDRWFRRKVEASKRTNANGKHRYRIDPVRRRFDGISARPRLAAASPPAARGNRAEAWREQLRPQGQSMRRRSKSLAFDKPRNLFASGSNVGRNVGPACLTLAERQQFAGRSAVCWVPVRALEKNHMNNGQNEECNDCEECHRQ